MLTIDIVTNYKMKLKHCSILKINDQNYIQIKGERGIFKSTPLLSDIINLKNESTRDIFNKLNTQYSKNEIIEAISSIEAQSKSNEKTLILSIRGTSMSPLLKENDLIKIKYVLPKELRLGDLITYYNNEKLITHRYFGKIGKNGQKRLIEKGDNSFFSIMPENQMIGRVIAVKRNNHFISLSDYIDTLGGYTTIINSYVLWSLLFMTVWGVPLIFSTILNQFNIKRAFRNIEIHYFKQDSDKIWFLKKNFVLNKVTGIFPYMILSIKLKCSSIFKSINYK